MSHLGMGKYYGKEIMDAEINDERLLIKFSDGITVKLWDDGRSCCESRYITCEDNPKDLIGGKLEKIDVKYSGEKEEDYKIHECVFIDVITNKGIISFTTHNEHNGYYGGFDLTITEEA